MSDLARAHHLGALITFLFGEAQNAEKLRIRLAELLPDPLAQVSDLDPALEEELRKIIQALYAQKSFLRDTFEALLPEFLGEETPTEDLARTAVGYMSLKRHNDERTEQRRADESMGVTEHSS